MIEALKDWDAAPSMSMLIETLRMLAVAAVRSLLVNMKYTSMGVYNLTSKKLLSATDEASLASTCRQLQAVVRPRNRHQASIVAARAAADIASFPSQRPVAETCLSPIVLNEYRHSLREQQNSAPMQGDRDDLLQQRKQLFTAPLDLELQVSEVKSLSILCRIIGNYCQPFFERYAAFNGAAAGDRAGLERGHVHKELKERAAQTPALGPFIAFLGGLTGCSPLDESRQLRLETVVPVVVDLCVRVQSLTNKAVPTLKLVSMKLKPLGNAVMSALSRDTLMCLTAKTGRLALLSLHKKLLSGPRVPTASPEHPAVAFVAHHDNVASKAGAEQIHNFAHWLRE